MSDQSQDQLTDDRIMFAVDYLVLMFHIKLWKDHQPKEKYNQISDFVALLFLAQWGYTKINFIEIMPLSNQVISNNLLPNLNIVVDRMAKYLQNDVEGQKKLIIQISAITTLNYGFLDCPNGWAQAFQRHFKFPIEEFRFLLADGIHWFEVIDEIGISYLQSGLIADEAIIELRKIVPE